MSQQDQREAFEFIEDLDNLASPDDVLRATARIVAGYGFEMLMFTGLLPNAKQRFSDVVLASEWPEEFLRLYVERDYIRYDPIARRGRQSAIPFEWDGEAYFQADGLRAAELMKRAADFRIARGWIVPIHGPGGYEACVSMSGVDIDLPEHLRPAIHLVALYAFERIRALLGEPVSEERPLSEREREVLSWAAEGKSAWEIGEILHITQRTVEEHTKNASRKLGAVNRTHAVAVALREHLIAI